MPHVTLKDYSHHLTKYEVRGKKSQFVNWELFWELGTESSFVNWEKFGNSG